MIQRKIKVVAFILFFLFIGLGGEGVSLASSDITRPTVKSLSLDKTNIQPGEEIKIEVEAEDLESGISDETINRFVQVKKKSGDTNYFIYLTYNLETKKYEGTFLVPDNAINGEWYISAISIEDKVGNRITMFPSEGSDFYREFIVSSGMNDTTKPTVKSLSLDKKTVQLGEEIKIEVEAEDLESGISDETTNRFVQVKKKSGDTNYFIYLTYNLETKKYEGTFLVPDNAINGEWYISAISIEDKVGNRITMFPSEGSDFYTEFIVSNGMNDTTKPIVKSLSLDKTTVQLGEEIKIEVEAEDLESGISDETTNRFVQVKKKSGDTNYFIYLTYNLETKKYEGTFLVPDNAINGEWYISAISIEDKVGNRITMFPSEGSDFYREFIVSNGENNTATPIAPNVNEINESDTVVSGKTTANVTVTVKVGMDEIGSGTANASGEFNITIPKQKAGTTIQVIAKDAAGNASTTKVVINASYSPVNIKLNGKDFKQGYFKDGTTYLNWRVLDNLEIPYTYKGNGLYEIDGRRVQGESINGELYLRWSLIAPGKVTYKRISGGYNFIYNAPEKVSSVKVQLNGKDFKQGYFKDGTTYVNWRVLETFKIPYTYKGNGLFEIEGRGVQGESINGELYLRWSLIAPGKLTYKRISGGYNFIYNTPEKASPVKVQLNGKDFMQGYFKGGTTYVHWGALNMFKIPFTYKGKGLFEIDGRKVQGESINGTLYLRWTLISPGKITFKPISGGYNFIFTGR